MKKKIFILLFICLAQITQAQNKGLVLDVGTGLEGIIWATPCGNSIEVGFNKYCLSDATALQLILPIHLRSLYQFNKWKLGVQASYLRIIYAKPFGGKYRSDMQDFDIVRFGINVERDVIVKRKYCFAPNIELGIFGENASHFKRENTTLQMSFKLGFLNEFKSKNPQKAFFLNPHLNLMTFQSGYNTWMNVPIRHLVWVFGVETGFRYRFK